MTTVRQIRAKSIGIDVLSPGGFKRFDNCQDTCSGLFLDDVLLLSGELSKDVVRNRVRLSAGWSIDANRYAPPFGTPVLLSVQISLDTGNSPYACG